MKYIEMAKFNKKSIQTHECIIIIGRRGTGKSVFVDTMLEYLKKKTFLVLLDIKDEYSHHPTLDIKTMLEQKKGVARVNSITYKGHEIKDHYIIAEFIAENLFKRGNCMLVIEELGAVCTKGGRLYDQMNKTGIVVQQGRKRDVGFIGISQRPQEIHTTFLSQADHIISFEVSSKHDLEAMSAYIDKDRYESLRRHEFFHYNVKDNYLKHCYKLYDGDMYRTIDYYKRLFGKS